MFLKKSSDIFIITISKDCHPAMMILSVLFRHLFVKIAVPISLRVFLKTAHKQNQEKRNYISFRFCISAATGFNTLLSPRRH